MINQRCRKEKKKVESQYLESTCQLPSHIRNVNDCSINLLPCFTRKSLVETTFPLDVDKGRLSGTRTILGPCMIEEIEGALWPIYGTYLGGQYRIVLPLLLTTGGSIVSA
jgi:hypothetical protein